MTDSIHMKFLKPFLMIPGIWPLELNGIRLILYDTLFYTTYIFFVLNVGTVYITTKEIFDDGKPSEITESMANAVFATLLCIKGKTYRSPGIRKLLKLITVAEKKILDTYDEESKRIYEENVKTTKSLGSIFIYQGVFTSFCAQAFPLINTLLSTPNADGFKEKYYIVPNWEPFDKYKYYYTAYIVQVAYTAIAEMYVCFCGTFFLFILKNITGQLRVLQHRFASVYERAIKIQERDGISFKEACHNVMTECIDYHTEIIKLVQHVDKTFYVYTFLDYVFTSFGLSLVVFEFLMQETVQTKIPAAGFLGVFAAPSLVLYYQADETAWESSDGLKQAIFSSNWYKIDTSVQKMLVFILHRTKKPLTLSIGPFRKVGTESMIALFKATYSYLSLMWK